MISLGFGYCSFSRQEWREVLEHEHWSQSVGAESEKRGISVDLGRRFLRVEDSWNDKGEVEDVFGRRKHFFTF